MSSNDDTRPGEMTDTQLDQLLAAANRELLGHIEATADRHRALIAIMAQDTLEASPSMTATPAASRDPGPHPAVVMITMRVRVRELVTILDAAHDLTSRIVPDSTRSFGLSNLLERARDHARELDIELACIRTRGLGVIDVLNDAFGNASDLDLYIKVAHHSALLLKGRRLDPDLPYEASVSNVRRSLDRARTRAVNLIHDLDAQLVDASGADLSALNIKHLDALDGIIWTDQTTWPSRIADQIGARSEEIRPGVYQIHFGDALASV